MLNLEEQIFKQIEKSKDILIVSANTKDALSSSLALFLFLQKLNYKVSLVSPEKQKQLSFLPEYSKIEISLTNLRRFIVSLDISNTKIKKISYSIDKNKLNFILSPSKGWFRTEDISTRTGEFKYQLIITIGVNNLESLEKIYDNQIEFFYKTPIINIDNSPSNEDFGQINFIDLNAVSNSEIIFYLLKNYKKEILNEDIATCLLSGIINKTRNFKTNNLTPQTLLTTSKLISLGGRREEIINNLYRSKSMSTLKLWGKILNNLRSENDNQLIWSKISKKNFNLIEGTEEGLIEIIDELIINIPETKLIAIFKEEETSTKVLLYSPKNINLLKFVKDLNPKGNNKIAWLEINRNLSSTYTEIVYLLKSKLEKIN